MKYFVVLMALIASTMSYGQGYRSYNEVADALSRLTANQPTTLSLESYGTSGQGRNLLALSWTQDSETASDKPQIMITAATHGDERITTEALLRYLESTLQERPRNPIYASLIEQYEIIFVPIVSPDSFERVSRTVNGVDPNRSFPGPGTNRQGSAVTAIQALIDYTKPHNIVAVIDLHAFGEVFLLPWGHTLSNIAPDDWRTLQTLANDAAAGTGYRVVKLTSFLGGRTAAGGSADYWYGRQGALSMGLEIARRKIPPTNQIPSVTDTVTKILDQYFLSILNNIQLGD